MPMADTLSMVREALEAGMTTGVAPTESYYVKTWYESDPLEFPYQALPAAVVRPGDAHRVDQYVQEDTEVDPVVIHFYTTPISRASQAQVATAAQVAMVDRATVLLRRDPTFGSRVYDGQVTGSVFRQPGFTESGVVHTAEVRFVAKRRVPWQAP